jgi:hypothetical protein
VLGRLIDLFDWAIGKRVTRFRIMGDGRLVHIKYYLFAAPLMAVLLGGLMSRFVAVIPLIMRGLLFLGEPLQSGMARGWRRQECCRYDRMKPREMDFLDLR